MPNPSLTDANTTGFVCIKHATTGQIQKIATTANFQVGLSNVPASLTVTGGDLTSLATTFNLLNEPITRTTNIATGAAVQTVTLGSSNSSSTLTLDAGSGGVNIGTNPGGSSKTINIGTTTGINTDINVGSEYLASKTVIKAGGPFATLGGLYLSGSTVTTYTIGGETGTGTITLGQSTDTNTINIGNANTTAGLIQTINIGAGTGVTSGKSLVTVGSTANASALTLNAGTGYIALTGHTSVNSTTLVNGLSDTSTDYSILLKTTSGGNTYRWGVGVDDTPGDYSFAYGLNNTTLSVRGWLSAATNVGTIDFTGQHRSRPASGNILDFSDKVGMIVVSVGQYKSLTSGSAEISINEALPLVELSTKRNQKSVFGVISDHEDPNETSRDYVVGNWGSVYEKMQDDDRLIINSLGEGGIWVCNINGNLENGDYITTCEIPGYGMKQEDDIMRNYTVAKITCDCSFDLNTNVYQCEEFIHKGVTYHKAFVGCTYHCG